MYYHVRLKKILHNGSWEGSENQEWDFRSLNKALTFVKRDFGNEAQTWRLEDSPGRETDLMRLERNLSEALKSEYQYIVLTFNDDSPLAEKYDHYEFFVVACDENERPPKFSFSDEEEAAIVAPDPVCQHLLRQCISDILKSFDMEEKFDFVKVALKDIYEFYCDVEDVPQDVRALDDKENLSASDYLTLGDECQACNEEQLAAVSYATAIAADGDERAHGEALAKLADLYMNSDWPQSPGRECDVMKAVVLLMEAKSLGNEDAMKDLERIREEIFVDYEDEPDVDYFIRNYTVDALCFAGLCLTIGLGWEKDVAAAVRLYNAAAEKGYEPASGYLTTLSVLRQEGTVCSKSYRRK